MTISHIKRNLHVYHDIDRVVLRCVVDVMHSLGNMEW
jgi:hypothetical protein